jgi:Exonuclease
MEEIKTIAFLDLELTGIPNLEFNRTKITEIAIVACSKQHILDQANDANVPRVLHKLTVCLNPFKRINVDTTEVTGLDNYMLEEERQFDASTVDLLKNFFNGLRKPSCLIAHNGYQCDFPVLRKEILACSAVVPEVLENLRCADSLELFRDIDDARDEREKAAREERCSDDEKLMTFVQKELESIEANVENEVNVKVEEAAFHQVTPDSFDVFCSQFDNIEEVQDWQLFNESTPTNKPVAGSSRQNGRQKKLFQPSSVTPTTPVKPTEESKERIGSKSRKRLFASPKSNRFKKGYRLSDIYQKIHGKAPDHLHRAEDDCMTLLKCVASPKYKSELFECIEAQDVCFRDIEPIGFKI